MSILRCFHMRGTFGGLAPAGLYMLCSSIQMQRNLIYAGGSRFIRRNSNSHPAPAKLLKELAFENYGKAMAGELCR